MSGESKSLNRLAGNLLVSLTTFVIFIIGWEAAVRGLGISKIVLPPPSAVVVAFWESLREGELHWHLAVTLYEVLAGFVVGSIGGLVLGFVIALSPLMERIFYPYVVAFQTVPKVAVAPSSFKHLRHVRPPYPSRTRSDAARCRSGRGAPRRSPKG